MIIPFIFVDLLIKYLHHCASSCAIIQYDLCGQKLAIALNLHVRVRNVPPIFLVSLLGF